MKKKWSVSELIRRAEDLVLVRAIRGGLVHLIPVMTIGAFALIGQTFPVGGYQRFLSSFGGGLLLKIFQLVYSATFGVLSVYMTYSISRAYMKQKADPETVTGGAVLSSLLSFFILAGAYLTDFNLDCMGPKSMFLAILTGLGASALYLRLVRFLRRGGRHSLFSSGVDREFNRMLATFLPIALVTLIFAVIDLVIMGAFRVSSVREGLGDLFNLLFSRGEVGFFKGFFFVLLSSLLWFFGIHGSDTLEGVMQTYFAPGLAANQAAVAAGGSPSAVLTKEFFDCFVLMGGCGAAICLLISLLLFSHNRARRGLGLAAALPMLFNINELMVFGLPIIFNPVMLIPFLATPLLCYSVAYLALTAGLVPLITGEVAWTTPILLGGFRATGSLAGSLLQLFNVSLGVLVYLPFVRLLDKQSEESVQQNYDEFMRFFRANEQSLTTQRLTEQNSVYGDYAKGLCAELRHELGKGVLLAYQPQYDYEGRCRGVEALLRWRHPVHGLLYPPLVIKLAAEGGFLPELEEMVLTRALADRPRVLKRFGEKASISVNVTGITVKTPRYLQFVCQQDDKDPFLGKNICIEITEQAALSFDQETLEALRTLRSLGIALAVDDFSMGQTSLHYLKDNLFDVLKLDGALVREMNLHRSSREVVASVVGLAESLRMTVLAEYVETAEQRDALHEIGCDCYQGYLYSPAVFLEE